MTKLLHKEKINWEGEEHTLKLFSASSYDGLQPLTQVQTVPFLDDRHIVVYKHIDGYYGLPGGSLEEGESPESALAREVREECACKILEYGLIGYVLDQQNGQPTTKQYQLRYWAKVELLDQAVRDPAQKAISREVVSIKDAADKLQWGERGEALIRLAIEHYKKRHEK